MHLSKLPTIFVKGGEERKAYFTVQARELIADGWVEQNIEEPKPVVKEEPKAKEESVGKPAPKVDEEPKPLKGKRTTKKADE